MLRSNSPISVFIKVLKVLFSIRDDLIVDTLEAEAEGLIGRNSKGFMNECYF